MRTRAEILVASVVIALAAAPAVGAEQEPRYCLDGLCRSTCILRTCLWVSTSQHFGIIEAENKFHVPIGVRLRYERLRNVTSYPPEPVF